MHHPPLPPSLDALPPSRLAAIALLALDCDGVMTDGRVWVDAQGNESKAFSVIDGHGLRALRRAGVTLALLTCGPTGIATARAHKLGFDHVLTDLEDKGEAMAGLLAALGLAPHQAAFVGDDLPDLAAFEHVGLRIAPPGARPSIKAAADAITLAPAGHGAVREVCDALLASRPRS